MTAIQIIDQIKALPPEEQAKVRDFVHQLDAAVSPHVQYADEKTVAEAAKWTFSEHAELMCKLSQ